MDNTENELFYMIPYGLFGLKEKYSLSDIDILICSIVYTCNRRNKTEYQEGYSTEEIAMILDMKTSTVRSYLKRGRERLKKLLRKDYLG